MKKVSLFSIIGVLAIVLCCTKETPVSEHSGYRNVIFDCIPETKVVLNAESGAIEWTSSAEYLGVYSFSSSDVESDAADYGKKFTKANDATAFTGDIVENAVKVFAIYPFYYSASSVGTAEFNALKCTASGVFTTMLAQTQTLVNNGISGCANVSVCEAAVNNNGSLTGTMKNVCAYLKFKIANSSSRPIRQILVESENGSKLAGLMTVSFDSFGNPVAEGLESSCVVGYAGGNTIEDGTYYLTILPGDFTTLGAEGLHITLSAVNGSVYEFSTPGFVAERNKVYDLGTIDAQRPSQNGKLSVFLNPGVSKMSSTSESTYQTVSAEGYSFGYVLCRQWGSNVYLFKENGFIVSPGISGKILKKINIIFDGHNTNNCPNTSIRYSSDPGVAGDTYLTGSLIPQSSVQDNRVMKFYFTANPVCKYFHQFYLGRNGDRESTRNDLIVPMPDTSYQIYIKQNNGLVSNIEFIYEKE